MRVLIDGIQYSLKKTGGIRRYFSGYLPLLKKIDKNIDVELFLHPGFKGQINFTKSIKISYLKEIPILLPKTIFEPLIEPINEIILQKQWLKIKGDIFHSTYYTRGPDKNIPQVVTVYDMMHEIFPHYFSGRKHDIFRKRKREVVESADAVICISQNTKKDLLRFYKVKESKTSVVYPGKDLVFRKISDEETKKRFIKKYKIQKPFLFYLGPRDRNKNFRTFIKAYALWKKRNDFEILTAGGNSFSKKEKLYFRQWKIDGNIRNFGYITDDDLVLFYNCAYAFVFPSLYEGFGIPLLEAMACGTLVLASNRSSFLELGEDYFIPHQRKILGFSQKMNKGNVFSVRDEKFPLKKLRFKNRRVFMSFDPEEVDDICRALNDMLSTKKRRDFIKRSLKRAKDFSWEKTAKQTLEVYKKF